MAAKRKEGRRPQRSEEHFRRVVESAPNAIVMMGHTGPGKPPAHSESRRFLRQALRRSGNPSGPTRYLSAGDCPGPISGSHQGQRPLRLHFSVVRIGLDGDGVLVP